MDFRGLGERAQARLATNAGDEPFAAAFEAVIGPDYKSNPTYLNLECALSVPFDQLSANGFAALYLGAIWGHAGEEEQGIEPEESRAPIAGAWWQPANV